MKTVIALVSLGLGFIIPGLSSEREVFNAGKKQELLSPAAAYALEAEDVKLLDALKNAGWDPSKQLGQMPDKDFYFKYTPLTFSTLVGAEGGVRWLLESCALSSDSRDGYLRRPIDVVIEWQSSSDGSTPSKEKVEAFLRLLQRKTKPEEAGALEELAYSVIDKWGHADFSIKSLNDAPAPDLWQHFKKTLERTAALEDRVIEKKRPVAILRVTWHKLAEDEYQFSVGSGEDEWGGGGVSGVIYHRYGYWLTKDVAFWDS